MTCEEKRSSSFLSYALAIRAANTLIRLGSLAAKLLFTLYMGRYLGLAEMGTYGLISAYVAIMVTAVSYTHLTLPTNREV